MQWTRSKTLALATRKCPICLGLGTKLSRRGTFTACDCVFRRIFEICYNRFQDCVTKEKYLSRVTMELHSGPNRRGTWGRKDEEYIADFLRMSERTLTAEEHRVFRYRYLLGADWRLCARKMDMDRGAFFFALYRIQTQLGQAFAETKPYGLFPLTEYFGSALLKYVAKALPARDKKVTPIRPPVAPTPDHRVRDKKIA